MLMRSAPPLPSSRDIRRERKGEAICQNPHGKPKGRDRQARPSSRGLHLGATPHSRRTARVVSPERRYLGMRRLDTIAHPTLGTVEMI
jgi:hypothetical protein